LPRAANSLRDKRLWRSAAGALKVVASTIEAPVIKRPRTGHEVTPSARSARSVQRQLRGGEFCDVHFGFGSSA
jgi:hypothetical protein